MSLRCLLLSLPFYHLILQEHFTSKSQFWSCYDDRAVVRFGVLHLSLHLLLLRSRRQRQYVLQPLQLCCPSLSAFPSLGWQVVVRSSSFAPCSIVAVSACEAFNCSLVLYSNHCLNGRITYYINLSNADQINSFKDSKNWHSCSHQSQTKPSLRRLVSAFVGRLHVMCQCFRQRMRTVLRYQKLCSMQDKRKGSRRRESVWKDKRNRLE